MGISVSGGDPRAMYPAARLIGQVLVEPLALASLVTGVALALRRPGVCSGSGGRQSNPVSPSR
jgi:hypothetical protein